MIHFTKQEQCIILSVALIVFFGAVLNYAYKRFPQLDNIVNFIDHPAYQPKVDLNTATAEELESIPYIGAYTAGNIVRYRQENGAFETIEQIKNVKGIRDKNFERFKSHIKAGKR